MERYDPTPPWRREKPINETYSKQGSSYSTSRALTLTLKNVGGLRPTYFLP